MFLWGILQEAAQPSPTRSPAERKIGDYFAACMDEAAAEKAGAEPLRSKFADIAALKKISDLAPLLARMHLDHIDHLTSMIDGLDERIEQVLAPFAPQLRLLRTIRGSVSGPPRC